MQFDPNANTPPYDRALCRALAEAGCDVELVTSRFHYENLPTPVGYRLSERFFRLPGMLGGRGRVAARPRVRRALKAAEYPFDWVTVLAQMVGRPPDVAHVQWVVEPALDLQIWHLLRRRGIPLVYTVHNLLPHHARPDDAVRYGRLYRAANVLVVHSERSATALVERWRVPRERIAVVPMGPMLEQHPPLSREAARRRLELSPDDRMMLFAGLIEPYKGLADLLDAFALMVGEHPNARLLVAGKPNESFEGYRAQIERLGLTDRTIVRLEFLSEPDLAAVLCAADVIVLPYRAVTSSAMLFAARRFGCPIVATDVGDLGELVHHGESGLLTPPNDPPALARAIGRLLSDAGLAARLGAEGQRVALTEHNWPSAAQRTVEAYRAALARRAGA
ncbi:MAG: glycosyltransferase family 4 protein [Chloroflexi bacterium]|nr:glycosyltransferase family 4 protein [Chloroflexota bacterium]